MSHNEIIERARDKVMAYAFMRIAQSCNGNGSIPEGLILIVYEEVLNAFEYGVNAKADAMMAQSELDECSE